MAIFYVEIHTNYSCTHMLGSHWRIEGGPRGLCPPPPKIG